MRLEKFKSGKNIYLRIAESYRSREDNMQPKIRVFAMVGKLSDYKESFEELREKFDRKEIFQDLINQPRSVCLKTNNSPYSYDDTNDSSSYLNLKNLGYLFIEVFYKKLQIDKFFYPIIRKNNFTYDLKGILKLLIYSRILHPCSKLATYQLKDIFHFPILKSSTISKHLYRCLDIFNDVSNSLQEYVYKKSELFIQRNKQICYYDLTNFYFEIEQSDEDELNDKSEVIKKGLRKKGVSKEHRLTPIVQYGLLMDSSGLPLSYQIYPGNTSDKVTLQPSLEQSIKKYNLTKIIVVADRITYTKDNINYLLKQNHSYVISKSILRAKKDFQEYCLDEQGYKWLNDNKTFKYKSRIITKTFTNKDNQIIEYKEKQVFYWSKAHYEQAIKQNKNFQDYLNKLINQPELIKEKTNIKSEFIITSYHHPLTGDELKVKKQFQINQTKIEKQVQLLGYYCICSNEITKSELELINIYRGLSKIEDSFKVMKSTLEGRPVYLQTPEHINAHFLICFLSLLIIRLIQLKIIKYQKIDYIDSYTYSYGLSEERIVKALNNYQTDYLADGVYKSTKIQQDLQTIFESFNLTDFKKYSRYPTNTIIKELSKELYYKLFFN